MSPQETTQRGLDRLSTILAFRLLVATVLLVVVALAQYLTWTPFYASDTLFTIIVITYLTVIVVGLLASRFERSPVPRWIYLMANLVLSSLFVQTTGGVQSGFTFLFILTIIDGAVLAGMPVALGVSGASSLIYAGQLFLQYQGIFPLALEVEVSVGEYFSQLTAHLLAFNLVGILAGRLEGRVSVALESQESAEGDLRRFRRLHARIVENIPIGVFTMDFAGRIQSSNGAAERILSEMGLADETRLSLELKEKLKEEGSAEFELSSGTRTLGISMVQSQELDPAEGHAIVLISDRTYARQLEVNLRKKETLAVVGQFAASLAHEIRNPLASISGSVEMLGRLRKSESSVEKSDRLENVIVREIQQLNYLVEDFLAFSRPSVNQMFEVDLTSQCRDLILVMTQDSLWDDKTLKLVSPEDIRAVCDMSLISRAIRNLLHNAREASASGGVVELRLSADEHDVIIDVVDNGEGLPHSKAINVFEPFETTRSNGTGLGLAIVQKVAEVHRGHFSLRNRDESSGCLARLVIARERQE